LVRSLTLEAKAFRQTQKLRPPWRRSASVHLYTTAMEGVMSKILFWSMVVLVFAFVGLVGCDYDPRPVGDSNPARVAEMKQTLRNLWVGHIFWVRHVVSNIARNDQVERDASEKEEVQFSS